MVWMRFKWVGTEVKEKKREGDRVRLSNRDGSGNNLEVGGDVNGERGTKASEWYWKEKGACYGFEWMKAPGINGESESEEAGEWNWLCWALSGVIKIRNLDSVKNSRQWKLARRFLISNRSEVGWSNLLNNLSKPFTVDSSCKTDNQCRMSIQRVS